MLKNTTVDYAMFLPDCTDSASSLVAMQLSRFTFEWKGQRYKAYLSMPVLYVEFISQDPYLALLSTAHCPHLYEKPD